MSWRKDVDRFIDKMESEEELRAQVAAAAHLLWRVLEIKGPQGQGALESVTITLGADSRPAFAVTLESPDMSVDELSVEEEG